MKARKADIREDFKLRQSSNGRVSTAAMIVMSSMILSRFTGFLRETMLSWKVGLSWVQDAYVAAFTIPDMMYVLLVGGTVSAALVPYLSGKLETSKEQEGWRAVSSFINMIFIITVLLCVLGIIFAPQIVPVIAPGFAYKSPQTKELSIRLTRILFPSVSFILLAGICNGVLNSYKKFAAAAYGPSIYNAGCAISILLFADTDPKSMVKTATGVLLSAFLYFLIQLFFAFSKMKFYRPIVNLMDKSFRQLFGQALPSLMSSSVAQINVVISTALVSLAAVEGGLAAFKNANTLWQLPYGIFAMGIGTAMLPSLAGKFASGEYKDYKSLMMRSLTSVLFVAIPSAAGFIVLRYPIVRAVFKWGGRFGENDVTQVSSIIVMFAVSIISQSIVAIMNRAFYAMQDTKTPLLTGICSVVLNLLLGLIFYLFTDLGASGVALVYSIISTVNAVILLALMKKKLNGIYLDKLLLFAVRAVPSALLMSVFLLVLENIPIVLNTKAIQLLYLAGEIIFGAAVYTGLMLLLKADEAKYLIKMLKERSKM